MASISCPDEILCPPPQVLGGGCVLLSTFPVWYWVVWWRILLEKG
jgi:hypothetical protein